MRGLWLIAAARVPLLQLAYSCADFGTGTGGVP
jgi:hypothetical protein